MKTEIQCVHFTADQKLLELIDKKLEKLPTFHPKITSAEVYLKLDEESSHIKDKSVEVKVHIPGHTLFSKEESKTFEEALSGTFDSIKRQLQKTKEKVRG